MHCWYMICFIGAAEVPCIAKDVIAARKLCSSPPAPVCAPRGYRPLDIWAAKFLHIIFGYIAWLSETNTSTQWKHESSYTLNSHVDSLSCSINISWKSRKVYDLVSPSLSPGLVAANTGTRCGDARQRRQRLLGEIVSRCTAC